MQPLHCSPMSIEEGVGAMSNLPSSAAVESLRSFYPPGTRVALVSAEDPYAKIQPGDQGSVMSVDDVGTILIQWDNGSILEAVYGEDIVRKL